MAKTSKSTKEERLQKSLNAASKILNKKMHSPFSISTEVATGLRDTNNILSLVTVFQVYCTDEEIVIGQPTTDRNTAISTRDGHNDSTGHISKILTSS